MFNFSLPWSHSTYPRFLSFWFLISCSLASIFTFTASSRQRFWCVSCYSCSPMSTTIRLIISIVCCSCYSISSGFFFFFSFCAGLQWSDQFCLSYDCPWLSFLLGNHHKELCSCSGLDNYLLMPVLVTFSSPHSRVTQFLGAHAAVMALLGFVGLVSWG